MKKKNKVTTFVLLWLPIVSFACSLFTQAPVATPTLETLPTFMPVTNPLVIEPISLPEAQAGEFYEVKLHITQNVTPVGDISIRGETLPKGLDFVFIEGKDVATISGIPQESGSFDFTVMVWCFGTMVSGQTLEKDYHLVVNESFTDMPTDTPIPTEGGWNYDYIATVPVASVGNSSQEEIASLLFTQWLNHFKTTEADLDHQLDDFELLNVVVQDGQPSDIFVAMVTFSVKPIRMTSWVSGNGTATDGIWVRHKLLFISVKKENDVYSLVSMGTGP